MKLQDFDFRIWDKTKEEFLKKEPTLIKIDNERVIAGRISRFYANTADITDMFIGNGVHTIAVIPFWKHFNSLRKNLFV